MPAPLGNRGFMMSAGLIGTVIFLLAAVVGITIAGENEARIEIARSSETTGKLQFIAEAIMADSYDVLLQSNLEIITTEFMGDEYDINTEEDWQQSFKSNMISYYLDNLGEALGMNMQAYAEAYSVMPNVDKCVIDTVEGAQSNPTVTDSDEGDGTIKARGHSYGERIKCSSIDPPGEVIVDIAGRYYRLNLRIPHLYDVGKWVASTAKTALNSGIEAMGIIEPIAGWESSKWHIVKKTDNTMEDASDASLEAIIVDWERKMLGFSDRILGVSNEYIKNSDTGLGYVGISLTNFEVTGEADKYELNDFEVSCVADGVGAYRNCMPFRLQIILGETECSIGTEPENSKNPFYSLKEFSARCGVASCSQSIKEVLKEIIRPLGSVCVDYYAVTDSVYPVCKKWEGKARSVVMKGSVKDDNKDYTVLGQNQTEFNFKDQQPNILPNTISDHRLKCASGDADGEIYKDNARRLLEKMQIKIGLGSDVGTTLRRWVDKGSFMTPIDDENLIDIYKTIYGQGILPIPCFTFGAKEDSKCILPEWSERPKVEMTIDWDDTRSNCINKVNELCNAVCGGTAIQSNTESFCASLFPDDRVGGGKGNLKCSCGETEMEIDMIGIGL